MDIRAQVNTQINTQTKSLLQLKEELSEEIRYDHKFTGVGISNNKIILFTNSDGVSFSHPNSDKIVVRKAIFKSKAINALLRQKFRPVVAGVSVGSINGLTGTAGFIYKNYLVSASHVLSSNPTGYNGKDDIIQPGAADGGTKNDTIGKTSDYDILRDNTSGDVGIATLSAKYGNIVYGIGPVNTFVAPRPGMKVVKVGRTTGMTMGLIFTTNTDAKVYYPELNREVFIKNQYVVYGKRFAEPGDSGSSVIYNNSVAGIVIAGDNIHTLCTPSNYIANKISNLMGRNVNYKNKKINKGR